MKILKNPEKVEAFWKSLENGRMNRLLMLDYDGTLAPFVVDRYKAYPYPWVRFILAQILQDKRNRVVIISGRNAKEVKALLGQKLPIEIWGGHGTERLLPSGELIREPVPSWAKGIFGQVEDWATDRNLLDCIEEKHGCLAFHVRGLEGGKVQGLLDDATQFFKKVSKGSDLQTETFDGGVELRLKGVDKGKVVRKLVSEVPANTASSYYGDDYTDEDAFVALGEEGVSFLVRQEFRKTKADVWIVPPDELKECLSRYIL